MTRRSPVRPVKVILYDPSGGGGVSHYTERLASHLVLAGVDVAVAAPDATDRTHHGKKYRLVLLGRRVWLKRVFLSVTRHRLSTSVKRGQPHGPRRNRFLTSYDRAAQIWSRLKFVLTLLREWPDVFHVQWLANPRADMRLMTWLRRMGVKVVYTVHNVLPHDDESLDTRQCYRRLYQIPDRLIIHADRDRVELTSGFDVADHRVSVIPPGALDSFFDRRTSVAEARAQCHIPHDTRMLLFFGAIRRYKGLEYLVEAFEQVQARIANVVLVIAGQVRRTNPEDFRFYTMLLEKFNGRDDIRVMNGHLPDDRVGSLFTAADIVVLPYVKTYTSGVLLAAYAAGKPVVATDTGALGEMVEAGTSGLLVPPRNARALADAIVELLHDGKRLESMGRYAGHLAATTYSWHRIATLTSNLYGSLIR